MNGLEKQMEHADSRYVDIYLLFNIETERLFNIEDI